MSRTAQTAQRREVETPPPQSRFKVGDRVRFSAEGLTKTSDPESARKSQAVVTEIHHAGIVRVIWESDEFKQTIPTSYHEDWLEKLEPAS